MERSIEHDSNKNTDINLRKAFYTSQMISLKASFFFDLFMGENLEEIHSKHLKCINGEKSVSSSSESESEDSSEDEEDILGLNKKEEESILYIKLFIFDLINLVLYRK